MTRSIWKYALEVVETPQTLEIPSDRDFLSCGVQEHQIVMWWAVDKTSVTDTLVFRVFPTGAEYDDQVWEPIKTVQMGPFVWHVMMRQRKGGL